MGILRADRITGLGGANAITGSVNFTNDGATSTGDYLRVDRKDNSDFNLSTNDFTIEFWMYSRNVGASLHLVTFAASTVSASSDAGFYVRQFGGVVQGYCFEGNNSIGAVATGSISTFRWYHIAYVRSGSTFTMYLDGTSTATATSSEAVNFDSSWNLNIGSAYTDVYHYNGFISNLRIINGTALYTSNFTVPNTRLTNVSNTVLLACQSSGNVLQEGTNKNIHLVKANSDNAGPVASKFTPNSPVGFSTTSDVGSQYGSTFDGVTTFDSQAYFVPPGGNTRERNRGRGLSMAGSTPSISNVITFIEMSSHGQTGDFGDLTQIINGSPGACSSSTRGIVGGGQSPSSNLNAIEFVTISNTANAQDFADLSVARRGIAACGNDTRGLWGGGRSDPSGSNPDDTIDFVTIATLGNASDFGNLSVARRYLGSTSSTTRGFWMGGNSPSASDVIDFITIASQGTNADDFGNLTAARSSCEACSSATRAIVIGGFISPAYVDTIDFFTMASSGDAIDFGDSTTVSGDSSPCSNSIRGYRVGGGNDSTQMNSIDFVTFSTTGNAQDFGDLPVVQSESGGCSDSHGGLS